jgi:regulator of replication initiation timing
MTYYPTLDEDLARAREILAKGQRDVALVQNMGGEAIYGNDIYAAYRLLESFVAELTQFLQLFSDYEDPCVCYEDALARFNLMKEREGKLYDQLGTLREQNHRVIKEREQLQAEATALREQNDRLRERANWQVEQTLAIQRRAEDAEREIERLRATLGRVEALIDIALPRFNWGASALDAEAIALLNEVPVEVKRVLYG